MSLLCRVLLIEHIQLLHGLGVAAIAVRKPEQLTNLDSLIIPGGESTTMGLIAERWALVEPLRQWVHEGRPTWHVRWDDSPG